MEVFVGNKVCVERKLKGQLNSCYWSISMHMWLQKPSWA